MQQTPVPTTEQEDDSITAKLMYQNRNALEDITGKYLETLKRDVMSQGLMLHGLKKILGLLDVLQTDSFSTRLRRKDQGEGNERGMMARRQEHSGFDSIHLYPVREREQQSRCFGHFFKPTWMVHKVKSRSTAPSITDRLSACSQER